MRLYKNPFSDAYSGTFNYFNYCDNLISIHEFAESLSRIIDAKSSYTLNHSEEVAQIAYLLAISYGLKRNEAEKVHVAGHLHDIGKVGIPDIILNKKRKLTADEWKIIKRHPEIGAEIISPVKILREIKDMVLYHHERFDGKGYPAGLKGDSIPIGARIIAVADAISAMLHDRPYRKRLSFEEALKELKINSGTQFDPAVVEVTISVYDEICKFF